MLGTMKDTAATPLTTWIATTTCKDITTNKTQRTFVQTFVESYKYCFFLSKENFTKELFNF